MKPLKIAFTKKYFPEQYHGEDYFIEYELGEQDTLCEAFKKAKEDTFECFRNNNPQIQWNDEVIQVNKTRLDEINDRNNEFRNYQLKVPPEPPNHSNQELIAMHEQSEKIKSGTIEEHNNYHSPDIETIKKEIKSYRYGVKALKSIYGEMVKDSPELKKVFDEKVSELEQKNQTV